MGLRLEAAGGVLVSGETKVGLCDFSMVMIGKDVGMIPRLLTQTICDVLQREVVLRRSIVLVEIWACSKETAPVPAKSRPQMWIALSTRTADFPLAILFRIKLAAGLFTHSRSSKGMQRVLVVEVDECVDEVVRRSYQSEARGASVLARSVLGRRIKD